MKFKTARIAKEWKSDDLDKRLRHRIECLDSFTMGEWGEEITLTDIYRTQEEQENIYGKDTKKKSVHQFWRGVDVRVRDFDEYQIDKMEDMLKLFTYDPARPYKKSVIRHNIKNSQGVVMGDHFHIQVYPE
jgi:hypothetical protein